jgi:hypothetical protein
MPTFDQPICEACVRLGPRTDGQIGNACAAFPDGIPEDIYPGGFDHRNPHAGDGGILFLLAPGQADTLARYDESLTQETG